MQFAIVIVRVAIDVVQINVGSMVEFILFIIIGGFVVNSWKVIELLFMNFIDRPHCSHSLYYLL